MRDKFDELCMETGYALAADRSTRTLPVVFAEVIFIGGWMIALAKAASSEPNPTNWPNVELQSVAISAIYLWVTTAVAIGAVIGTTQTEGAVPRILEGFERRIEEILTRPRPSPEASPELVSLPEKSGHSTSVELRDLSASGQDQIMRRSTGEIPDTEGEPLIMDSLPAAIDDAREQLGPLPSVGGDEVVIEPEPLPAEWRRHNPWATEVDRALQGGVLNWKPYKWLDWYTHWVEDDIGKGSLVWYSVVGVGFVGMGYATAAVLSSLPAPRGFSCRHITETLM